MELITEDKLRRPLMRYAYLEIREKNYVNSVFAKNQQLWHCRELQSVSQRVSQTIWNRSKNHKLVTETWWTDNLAELETVERLNFWKAVFAATTRLTTKKWRPSLWIVLPHLTGKGLYDWTYSFLKREENFLKWILLFCCQLNFVLIIENSVLFYLWPLTSIFFFF